MIVYRVPGGPGAVGGLSTLSVPLRWTVPVTLSPWPSGNRYATAAAGPSVRLPVVRPPRAYTTMSLTVTSPTVPWPLRMPALGRPTTVTGPGRVPFTASPPVTVVG